MVLCSANVPSTGVTRYNAWPACNKALYTAEHERSTDRHSQHDNGHHQEQTGFPAAFILLLNEDFSTDTMFSDVAAHDNGIPGYGGCTLIQVFTGSKSDLTKVFSWITKNRYIQPCRICCVRTGPPIIWNPIVKEGVSDEARRTDLFNPAGYVVYARCPPQ